MEIFQQEIDDNLSSVLESSNAIKLEACVKIDDAKSDDQFSAVIDSILRRSKANSLSLPDISKDDLAVITSVLVSQGCNLNDDIFLTEELYAAKNTPVHKPINIDHDQELIIGHIFDSRMLDSAGAAIDNKPSEEIKCEIEVVGVLYKFLDHLQKEVATIIDEAKNGKIFVSMECLFDNFDYGLMNPSTNTTKIIKRDKDTAFLTKYLRVYGGSGKYQGYNIGRVLRNIDFIGKGIVKNPANPGSIIKDVAKTQNEVIQGDNDNMDKALEQSLAELETVKKELASKSEELAKAADDKKAFEAKIVSLESEAAKLKAEIENYIKSVEEANQKWQALFTKASETEKALEDAKKQLTEVQAQLSEFSKKELASKRFEELSKVKKIDNREDCLAELANMSDETFKAVIKYAKSESDNKDNKENKENKDNKEQTVANTDEAELDDILNEIEEEEGALLNSGVNSNSDKDGEVALATARCLLNRGNKKDNE